MISDTINDAPTMQPESVGTLLAGRYRIVRQLGRGGMGSVWLAEDTQLDDKQFAIKMLPSILVANKRAYRQLKDEALVAMRLVHPNIVQIRAFEENNGNPFLVMDYIDGQTLDDYLAEHGGDNLTQSRREAESQRGSGNGSGCGLPEEDVVRILKPIAAALDYAHGEGVVHRDVKPANVMIRKDGHPFILDFGIAREIQETMTRVTGKLSSGTLLYMSPEQLNGEKPSPTQDVYSFAATVYECLKGEPPFVRGAIEDQIKNKLPDPLPVGRGVLSVPLAASIMVGLAKKAKDRPRNCAAVLEGDKVVSRRGAEAQRSFNSCAESVGRGAPTAPQGRAGSPLPAEIGRARSPNRSQPQGGVVASGSVKINVPKSDWPYLPPDMRPHPGGGAGRGLTAPQGRAGSPLPGEIGRARSPSGPQRQASKEGGAWKMFLGLALLGLIFAGTWIMVDRVEEQRKGGEEDKNAEEPIARDRTAANEIRNEAVAQQREVDDISDEDGFAQEKKGLADVFKKAAAFFKEEHWSEAAVGFTNYVEECKLLKKLDGERNSAVNARDLAKKEKEAAEKVKAEKYVKSLWDGAVKSFNLGNRDFGNRQFLSASNLLATAAIKFKQCVESIPPKPSDPSPRVDDGTKKAALEIFEKAKELRNQMAQISGDDGFEALKNALSTDFKIANGFLTNECWEVAAKQFTVFVKKVKAMLKLDEKRCNAWIKKNDAEGAKTRAQEAGAETYAFSAWNSACVTFNKAKELYKNLHFSEAEAKFKEAFGLFEDCERNAKKMAEAKREAQTARNEAEGKKSQAERMRANEVAYSTWNSAISSLRSGDSEFQRGNFFLASQHFKSAKENFESCINAAKRNEIEKPIIVLTASINGVPKAAHVFEGLIERDRCTPVQVTINAPLDSEQYFAVEYMEDGVIYRGVSKYIVTDGRRDLNIEMNPLISCSKCARRLPHSLQKPECPYCENPLLHSY